MPDRPTDAHDVNPARVAADPLLRAIADLVGYLDLHLGRHPVKQLTTEQKELWADLVDSDAILTALDEPFGDAPRRSVRWWREKPARPIGEEGHTHGEQAVCRSCGKQITWDADTESFWVPYVAGNPPAGTFHCPWGERHWALPAGADEPDPFRYTDEGGDRVPEAVQDRDSRYDEGAASVARAALLDVADRTHPHWHHRHQDLAAVYEWAKRSVRPVRRTDGEIGVLRAYPSLNEARSFLVRLREQRREQPDTHGD